MNPTLVFEPRECALPFDRHRHFGKSSRLRVGAIQGLDLEAMTLGIALVHPRAGRRPKWPPRRHRPLSGSRGSRPCRPGDRGEQAASGAHASRPAASSSFSLANRRKSAARSGSEWASCSASDRSDSACFHSGKQIDDGGELGVASTQLRKSAGFGRGHLLLHLVEAAGQRLRGARLIQAPCSMMPEANEPGQPARRREALPGR